MGAKYVNPVIKPTGPMTDLNGNVDPGRERPRRLPGLRRDGGHGLALVRRADAGGRHPGHVRLHLRRPRRPRQRRATSTSRTGPARPATSQQLARLRRSRSSSSSTGSPPTGSTSRTRCSCSPSTRATTSSATQPTPAAATASPRRATTAAVGEINGDLRRMIRTQFGDTTQLHGPLRRRAERLRHRQPGAGPIRRSAQPRARDGRGCSWLNPYTGPVETGHHGGAGRPDRG